MLRKTPGFTAIAVMTLALGIGANTAMFTVVESVMVRQLPYAHAPRMVSIGLGDAENIGNASYLNFKSVKDQTKLMDDVACYISDVGVVQGKSGSVSVTTIRVTPNLFNILGMRPIIGRTFSEAEGQIGGPQAVLLAEGTWKDNFGGDPQIIGTTVRVNNQERIVVGVMPAGFHFPDTEGSDIVKGVWIPMQPTKEKMESERGFDLFDIVGLLKPGVTVAQEQTELGVIVKEIQRVDAKETKDLKLFVQPYQKLLTGSLNSVFISLVVALGLVMLRDAWDVSRNLRCLAGGSREMYRFRAEAPFLMSANVAAEAETHKTKSQNKFAT